MKVGDLVRYTGSGQSLGIGIVLRLFPYTGNDLHKNEYNTAEVVWNGVDQWPVRHISWKWLEVINESR